MSYLNVTEKEEENQMKNIRVNFSYKGLTYDFTLENKFTIVIGPSASGKTTFVKAVAASTDVLAFNSSPVLENITVVKSFDNIDKLLDNTDDDRVFVLDETIFALISASGHSSDLLKATGWFIIMYRDANIRLSISYKCYYQLKRLNDIVYLVRSFPDYETFVFGNSYIVEDSGSGFMYYKTRLNNVETAGGNVDLVYHDAEVVIAVGAVIAPYFRDLRTVFGDNLFLPHCFEFLVLQALYPSNTVDSPEWSDKRNKYYSLERFSEDVLKVAPIGFAYNKNELHPKIYESTLVPDLETVVNPLPTMYVKNFYLKEKRLEILKERNLYHNLKDALNNISINCNLNIEILTNTFFELFKQSFDLTVEFSVEISRLLILSQIIAEKRYNNLGYFNCNLRDKVIRKLSIDSYIDERYFDMFLDSLKKLIADNLNLDNVEDSLLNCYDKVVKEFPKYYTKAFLARKVEIKERLHSDT